jgi:DNA replication protein DnaC
MTFTTWLENLALARSAGTYLKFRDKLANPDLVILDDFGMRKMTATEAQNLCELLEERSIEKATLFTTQLPLAHWTEVIGDPARTRVRGDAVIRGEKQPERVHRKVALKRRSCGGTWQTTRRALHPSNTGLGTAIHCRPCRRI